MRITFKEILAEAWRPNSWKLRQKAVVASRLAHSTADPIHRAFYFQVKTQALRALCQAEETHRAQSATCTPRVRVTVDPRLKFKGLPVISVRAGKMALHVPKIHAPAQILRLLDQDEDVLAGGAR